MLRMTIITESDRTVLKAEGKLSGPWVQELDSCYRKVRDGFHVGPVIVDLTNVGFADDAGKELIGRLHECGVEVSVAGPLMTAIMSEIERSSGHSNSRRCHESSRSEAAEDCPH